MKLISAAEMGERIGGLTLWAHGVVNVLGVQPVGRNAEGFGFTEQQFIEVCDALTARIAAARAKALDDDEL